MKKLLTISAITLLCIYSVSAQKKVKSADEKAVITNIESPLKTPFGVSSLGNFFSNVSVSSFFKEGVNGKIELQGNFKKRWSGGLTIDQKIGKGSNEATPLDLSGISPGTTVKLNLKKLFWKPNFDKITDAQLTGLKKTYEEYANSNGIADYRTVGLNEVFHNGTETQKTKALAVFNSAKRNPFFINFEVGFTKTSFSYTTDSFLLKENKEAFITPAITFSLVQTLGNGFKVNGYVSLSYNYTESYSAADDIAFNIPFGTSNNYYSNTLSFGTPVKKTSHNIIAELRENISENIAIAPSVTFGINNKKLGAFIPVYFIKGTDEKGKLLDGLQGGIRFGYITSTESGKISSFKKGFTAQLIISQPLDFLSKL